MRTHTTTLLIAASLLLSLPLSAAAQAEVKPPATPTRADAQFNIDSPTHATAIVVQVWEGEKASAMRQSLNAIFGNSVDTTLNANELNNIARAVENDLMNASLPIMQWDGQHAVVRGANVSFESAAEDIKSQTPLTMRHELDLQLAGHGDTPPYALEIDPMWQGTVSVKWTPDWGPSVMSGLDAVTRGTNDLSGGVSEGRPVVIQLVGAADALPIETVTPTPTTTTPTPTDEPPTPTGPQLSGQSPTQESVSNEPPANPIPAPTVIGIVGALGVALLVASRRRH